MAVRSVLCAVLAGLVLASAAADPLPAGMDGGSYPARVLRVGADGRVLAVVHLDGTAWPAWWRLAGVDLPDAADGAACADERSLAAAAARSLAALTIGQPLRLADVDVSEPARPAGRILLADGRDVGAVLVAFGLARRAGTAHRDPWCGW